MEEPLELVDNNQNTDDDITKQRNKDAERKKNIEKLNESNYWMLKGKVSMI